MPEDLPIYSESMLRTRQQFADLERLKGPDLTPSWTKSDAHLEQMEGAANVGSARSIIQAPTKSSLLEVHKLMFSGREGAGELRRNAVNPLFRGHDCPEPEFIDHSLDNFFTWMSAESLSEMHPIEKAALVLSRIVDIWPFEFGNLTTAIVFANLVLRDADLAPFFVRPEHLKEFNKVIAQAMAIETQPLVNAIYRTIKREMEAVVP